MMSLGFTSRPRARGADGGVEGDGMGWDGTTAAIVEYNSEPAK